LAALSSAIVGRKSTPRPHIAATVPHGPTPASRVTRLARWCDTAHLLAEVYFLPSVDVLLRPLAWQTVGLGMDGSRVGRGCTALLIHVVSQGCALPRAWRVRQTPQGHLPDDRHIAWVEVRREGLPAEAHVVLRGDGEWDGTPRRDTLHKAGWSSVCRTALRTVAPGQGATVRLDPLGACRTPGRLSERKAVQVTREAYGPVMGRSGWAKGYQEPLDWLRNRAHAEDACRWDATRFRSETCFSDQQRRGFHRHKSPMSDVQRLSRRFIAAWLAYLWMVY